MLQTENVYHEIILKAKGDINAKNVWGRTPLMEAIVQFRYEMVDYLLAEGADVNIADDHKTTPLHVCASYGNLTCLKTMLANGDPKLESYIFMLQPFSIK
jgi:ankyrin repeat protein